jgi:hypothetical protein
MVVTYTTGHLNADTALVKIVTQSGQSYILALYVHSTQLTRKLYDSTRWNLLQNLS